MNNESQARGGIRFGALTFHSNQLRGVPRGQYAPQDISATNPLPSRMEPEREKRTWSSPLGPGPSQRNCLLCNTPVKRGEVMDHRQGWLHVDRSRTKGFYCELCNKAFMGPFGIWMHCERSHPPPDVGNLSINTSFTTPSSTRKERKRIKAVSAPDADNLLQETPNAWPCTNSWRSGAFCVICSTYRAPGEKRRSHKRSQQHIDMCKAQGLYCGDCDIIFNTTIEQCMHADTHKISSPKRCCICDEEMVESGSADGQLQIHNDTFKRSELVCSECNMDFGIDKENFLAHVLKSHVSPRPVRFNCSQCNQDFLFQEYIKHSCLNPTTTEEIPSVASYSAEEIPSVASYSAKELKPIACLGSSKCQRRFNKLSEMIQHLEGGQCIENTDSMGINVLVVRNYTKTQESRSEVDEEADCHSGGEQGSADACRTSLREYMRKSAFRNTVSCPLYDPGGDMSGIPKIRVEGSSHAIN
ncbi:hypothetical protein K440DRAFT_661512 [Wilcoxina mikolae CBS 423.85]|nr:hypothetical protein K440DRAFT_661512 [Wilcoxina mikolae CBS 423.85]